MCVCRSLSSWQLALVVLCSVLCFLLLVVVSIKRWMCFLRIRSSIGRRPLRAVRARSAVAPPVGTHLRVLSLNLFLRSLGVSDAGTLDDWKASRLEEFVSRYMGEYDVVCLQEVFGVMSILCKRLLDRADQLGFHWRVVPEHPALLSLKFMDSGLVILSRYPILHAETHVFRSGCHADKLAAKSFQYCTIDLGALIDGSQDEMNRNGGHSNSTGGSNASNDGAPGIARVFEQEMCSSPHLLHVVNTHLQSDYQVLDVPALEVKFQQLGQIRRFLDERGLLTMSAEPLLLAGDFNLNAAVWSPELTVVQHHVSPDYLRAMDTLGFQSCHDVLRPSGVGGREPTAFCTYERTGTQRELDTRRRDEDDAELRAHPSWANLARSVDYLWFTPPRSRWLEVKEQSGRIETFPTVDPANKIGGCSDHYGITVTMEVNKHHEAHCNNNDK